MPPFSGAPPRTRVSRPTSRCRVQNNTHTNTHKWLAQSRNPSTNAKGLVSIPQRKEASEASSSSCTSPSSYHFTCPGFVCCCPRAHRSALVTPCPLKSKTSSRRPVLIGWSFPPISP